MLDKSVPHAKLYMRKQAGTPVPGYSLPRGFRYCMYNNGDDEHWARIETSVLEFDSEFSALMCFKQDFIPYEDELYRRLLFIETDDGFKVATANAWWAYVSENTRASMRTHKQSRSREAEDRRAWIHWVAVDPKYQGLGLGKAVIAKALEIMREIEGDVDIYLSTQTWSYKAIDIYKKCGFEPTDEAILYTGKSKNDYKKAMKILEEVENGKLKIRNDILDAGVIVKTHGGTL